MEKKSEKKCCLNCRYLVQIPKNNRYGDIETLCAATGYFCGALDKETNTVRRTTPGGKELVCRFEKKHDVLSENQHFRIYIVRRKMQKKEKIKHGKGYFSACKSRHSI